MSYDIDRRKDITTRTIRLNDEDLKTILNALDRGSTILLGDLDDISPRDPVEYSWYKWVVKMELKYRRAKDRHMLDALHKIYGGGYIG